MDLKEIGTHTRNWVDSTQNRDGLLESTFESGIEPMYFISHRVGQLVM